VKPVHCKSCRKLLGKYHVLVGEIQCPRCNYRTEYRVLTERFIQAIQHGDTVIISGGLTYATEDEARKSFEAIAQP